MEWAVCTASSDSEDSATQEINEEEGSPPNRDQHYSIYGAGEQSSTRDAHGSIDLTFVTEAASTRIGWDSMDPVKAEAGKKPSDQRSRDFTHFEKKQGIKLFAPDSRGPTCTVNISEGAGRPDCEPENITMQLMSKEDEERELVTPKALGALAEEHEFYSSTSTNGVSQKLNPGRSDVQRMKRNLTEDGQGQASKLVKRFELPQEKQMPCASTECGESVSGPSCAQWNESLQSRHQEGNGAAEEPVSCAESKEMLSHSSELVEQPEVQTGEGKYHCEVCNFTFGSLLLRDRHRLSVHGTKDGFKCPLCKEHFPTKNSLRDHCRMIHFRCTKCNLTFDNIFLRDRHRSTAHGYEECFKCPDCRERFPSKQKMRKHWHMSHLA